MTASAQLDTLDLGPAEAHTSGAAELPSALKLEVAERLEAHRRRKAAAPAAPAAKSAAKPVAAQGRRASLAASVAERYAQTPSYRAFLAEQAQRAIEEAAAAADVAARSARAVAEVQSNLLAELELWNAPQEFSAATAQTVSAASAPVRVPMPEETSAEHTAAGLTVRLYDEPVRVPPPVTAAPAQTFAADFFVDHEEAQALDEEIAFRQSPVFEDFGRYAEPAVPLPANLLEFPRQLIAARKARPRIAEGPLLEEAAPRAPQLRIFEVEADQFAPQPEAAPELPPVQSFIYLDAQPASSFGHETHALPQRTGATETASIVRRLFALAVDGTVVGSAVAAFAWTADAVAGTHPAGMQAVTTVVGTLVAFWVIYQILFFTLAEQTPGMRCARIGLCTLTDENPTRKAMRRRILAQWIAVLPLGLGVLWALLDDDRLGWHDRISHMYQRAY